MKKDTKINRMYNGRIFMLEYSNSFKFINLKNDTYFEIKKVKNSKEILKKFLKEVYLRKLIIVDLLTNEEVEFRV